MSKLSLHRGAGTVLSCLILALFAAQTASAAPTWLSPVNLSEAGPTAGSDGAQARISSGAPQQIASVQSDGPIAAYDGWLAWSIPVSGGWGLEVSHDGAVEAIPVAPRTQPFDVDLGSNAAGAVVATFSRCAKTPGYNPYGYIQEMSGSECRVHVLNLQTGVERAPAIPHPFGASDTTPSIWHGNIAFARLDRSRDGRIAQVLLWSPGARRLRTVPQGETPTKCSPWVAHRDGHVYRLDRNGRCNKKEQTGTIYGVDLGPRLLAFLWGFEGAGGLGEGDFEIRADRLGDETSTLIGTSMGQEECVSAGSGGSRLSAPFVEGENVWYTSLHSDCYDYTQTLSRFDIRARRLASAKLSGVDLGGDVLQVVRSGGALFALVAVRPSRVQSPPECSSTTPCAIERLETPPLIRSRIPKGPVFEELE
jgi:hypothetical protein